MAMALCQQFGMASLIISASAGLASTRASWVPANSNPYRRRERRRDVDELGCTQPSPYNRDLGARVGRTASVQFPSARRN